jgi:hypothetical protein
MMFTPESLLAQRFRWLQRGQAVRDLQLLLGLPVDGVYRDRTAVRHREILEQRGLPISLAASAPSPSATGTTAAATTAPVAATPDAAGPPTGAGGEGAAAAVTTEAPTSPSGAAPSSEAPAAGPAEPAATPPSAEPVPVAEPTPPGGAR